MTLLQQQGRNSEVGEPEVSEGRKEVDREIKKLELKGQGDTGATFVFMCCFFQNLSSLNAETKSYSYLSSHLCSLAHNKVQFTLECMTEK